LREYNSSDDDDDSSLREMIRLCDALTRWLSNQKYNRVARWFVFEPKIRIWVNLEGIAMENLGIFNGHLVYFLVIWNFSPVLVFLTKKNLATLKYN
jgi:hypothetical protein